MDPSFGYSQKRVLIGPILRSPRHIVFVLDFEVVIIYAINLEIRG